MRGDVSPSILSDMLSSGTRDTLLVPLRAAGEHAPQGEPGDLERALLRALAAGRLGDVDTLLSTAGRTRGGGRRQGDDDLIAPLVETDAGARTVGIDVAEVQAVVERVEQVLPRSSRLRLWAYAILAERLLLDFVALVSPAPRPSRSGLELRVMVPVAELVVDGTTVALGAAQVKLLLALALAHPTPLHVEQAIDLLWSADPLPTTRNRLTSLVHRLRRTLGDHDDALARTGDLLALHAGRWDVDLWRLRTPVPPEPPTSAAWADAPTASTVPATSATERRRHLRALADVRGNLCDAQFPYEELFVDWRHRLCAVWLRYARRAVAAGELQPADLEEALAALGLGPDDLQP